MSVLSPNGYRIKIFGRNKKRAALVWMESEKREAIRTARRLVRKRGAGASANVLTVAGTKDDALIYQCHAVMTKGTLELRGDEL